MFLLLYGCHAAMLVPLGRYGISIQNSMNLGETLFRQNRTDPNLGKVVCLSIVYHIPDFLLNLLNGYDFHFRCKTPILIPDDWTALFSSPGFINVFSMRATGFYRWIKLPELNFFVRIVFL